MASVLDRPLFQKKATERVARERLNKLGNIQDYASEGMFGVGGTMEDTGLRYQQPFGYSEGQVDPGILGAVRQRALQGSQIVQGGEYTNRDVPDLRARFQASRNDLLQQIEDAQVSSDPSKYEVIKALKDKLAELDQTRDQLLEKASGITYTAEDKYGMLSGVGAGTPDVPEPMGPGEMDIFRSISERAAGENLKQKPPVFGGAPAQKPVVTAEEAQIQNQSGPSGMEMEARKLPKDTQGVQKGPTGMEAEVLGRKGSITPADVAAALNDPKPEVREKTAADFAKQFADMGPKYEGIDKGLLLAQIGFAIAAGESPNAMSNIANGLSLGADTAIKDKAAKGEFDRQIQLAAMQYGLGEAGKLESEKRAMAREGKNGTHYVADRDITLGGRKYTAGQSVFLPNSTLWETGVPEGLVTESMADSVSKNRAALEVALKQAEADKVLSVTDFNKLSGELNTAADSLESTRALRPLLEASIIRAANGTVTGVNASIVKWVNRGAAAAGVDLGKSYEDPARFEKDMLAVSNRLIQEILRESGRNISGMDRQIVADIVGRISTDYEAITADANVLLGSLQNVLSVIDSNEQAAIDQYTTITRNTAGLLSPSGGELILSDRASRVFQDTAPVDMNDLFSYDEKTGIWNQIEGQ
jgi:hypothetical protein